MPLIKQLSETNTVIIGVTKTTSLIFNEEFSLLKKIDIEPYSIRYSKWLPVPIKLIVDAPRILTVIKKEREQLTKIIAEYNIDVVISDNRFGLFNAEIECIYITHQLNIQAGLFSWIANKIHNSFIKKFNAVWVPDFEEEEKSLAGKLSHHHSVNNINYVGALSRLQKQDVAKKEFDYLFLISGPEPQRTVFENILMNLASSTQKKIAVVRGTKTPTTLIYPKNCLLIEMPTAQQLATLIQTSNTIICRSGYSTLMDLYALQNTNCILVPTPHQTEQSYLANYWKDKFNARVVLQKELVNFKL